jgi:nicotinamidase-related amidase
MPNKLKPGQFTEEYITRKLKEEYEHGKATFGINPRKSALIVVDMTIEFTRSCYSPLWVPNATNQIPKIKSLIEACRKLDVPVIYTCFSSNPTMIDLNPYFKNRWTPADRTDDFDGPPLLCTRDNIDPELKPIKTDIIIEKISYGAFTHTPLDYVLHNLGRDTVIICGTKTNYCCGTTAREAHARGYKVVFGSDINSTDEDLIQDGELRTIRRGFGLVLTKNEILEALAGRGEFAEK